MSMETKVYKTQEESPSCEIEKLSQCVCVGHITPKVFHTSVSQKGFFILTDVIIIASFLSRFGMQGQAIRCLRSTNCIYVSAFYI